MPPMMVEPERDVPGTMARHLEAADLQRGFPIDVIDVRYLEQRRLSCSFGIGLTHARMTAARRFHFCERFLETATIASLEHDEHNAVQNEHGRDGDLVIEILVHEVVERKTEHGSRQASNDDHAPQAPRAATSRPPSCFGEKGLSLWK